MNNNEVKISIPDAREILRLLNACNLDGLRGATLEAARLLLEDRIGEALQDRR